MTELNAKPKGISAQQAYLDKVTKQNRANEQQARIDTHDKATVGGLVVPDLNPADRAVAKMQHHAKLMYDFQHLPRINMESELLDRVVRLENTLQLTLDSLNAATITCSGSSIVLTFPDLPT